MSLLVWATDLMQQFSYAGLVFLMLAESVFPPIPSEVILPLAGLTAADGKMNIWLALVAATSGAMLGAAIWYWLSRTLGEAVLRGLLDTYERWMGLSAKDLDRAEIWFADRGARVVFWGRMIPGARSVISIPAGLSRMSFGLFMLWSTLGTLLWSALLIYIGWLLEEQFVWLAKIIDDLGTAVVWLIVAGVVFWVAWRIWRTRVERQNAVDRRR